MINAEKLLRGLVKHGLSSKKTRRSAGKLLKGGLGGVVGIGALGIAVAAVDHFSRKGSVGAPQTPPQRPPVPPPVSETGRTTAPPPPPQPVAPAEREDDALLLIRAMIAAANADGLIDEQERAAVLGELKSAGLSAQEEEFINRELDSPSSIDSLLPQVSRPDLAREVYAVSLLAIEVDTKAERDYLSYLRTRLSLDEDSIGELHDRFGIESD